MEKVGVIGGGSLGTAIAQIASQNVDEVYLHLRRKELADIINQTGFNNEYYPNTKLNNNIKAITDFNKLKDCEIIFLSVPSSAFRETLSNLQKFINESVILVSTAKGIEYPSLKTMGNLIEEYFDDDYVSLSGPNFASEMVLNLETVSNIASKNKNNSKKVKEVLTTQQFKLKIIDDVVGLEICGVIKNINAMANGICKGMDINENARYAILTKGFEETQKIVEAIGGNPSTVKEYCGFGDLVLTSTSNESRNHTLGMLYGQRIIVDEDASGIVVEGKKSIKAIKDICKKYNTESIIVDFVYDVVIKHVQPKIAFKRLWEKIEN
ncbi:NAD(P)H-dependent glycerol-3-phosphate dehydrogenase [Methanobrevibacter olleyae]|uniref:Glycerol-3-phosphate dehydrogenase [NAD(P)+] n=1 Tax=Methanobrevibacter olleyae TaxID=294671 RepID=A0A126R2C7_METOL|nr:NAD(P)H-dependent glycerol-3-phosphate dehydrogenase [Methanobrevibacter olleyae]AMK16196.1 glycerol-3-phosphate dehydrogenase [Methanobrevibacter olleyae]SFL53068.1 glycerol-3-phosphate dehydrogenase (NAD(P)+) [Methanobrevibacter olleyae]